MVFETRAALRNTMEALSRRVVSGELDKGAVNATVIAASCALQAFEAEERSSAKRAAQMTDDELEEAISAELNERRARLEANQ